MRKWSNLSKVTEALSDGAGIQRQIIKATHFVFYPYLPTRCDSHTSSPVSLQVYPIKAEGSVWSLQLNFWPRLSQGAPRISETRHAASRLLSTLISGLLDVDQTWSCCDHISLIPPGAGQHLYQKQQQMSSSPRAGLCWVSALPACVSQTHRNLLRFSTLIMQMRQLRPKQETRGFQSLAQVLQQSWESKRKVTPDSQLLYTKWPNYPESWLENCWQAGLQKHYFHPSMWHWI